MEESYSLASDYTTKLVIIAIWHWHKNTDQWKGIERPEMNPFTYKQLIYDKGGKNIKRREFLLWLGRLRN